jgi:hypothetical protein
MDFDSDFIRDAQDAAGQAHSGESVRCESCGGPRCLLGTLGRQTWARCRDCGWDAVIDHHELEGH